MGSPLAFGPSGWLQDFAVIDLSRLIGQQPPPSGRVNGSKLTLARYPRVIPELNAQGLEVWLRRRERRATEGG